ncbi:MAG: hypothetical protein IJ777_01475 [Clostridia bacterium]|nr:hypothetical protein [Clostridia bacterium]
MVLVDLSEFTKGVRQGIARETTNGEVLEQLAHDVEWLVRAAVANNRHTFSSTLEKLSDDSEWIVRRNVANNANKSLATKKKLAQDENKDVRAAAGR